MKNISLLLITILGFSLISCTPNKVTEPNPLPVAVTPQEPAPQKLPTEVINDLFQNANGFEATFYHSGKSVSLWEENVKSVLAMTTGPAPAKLDNNVIGHYMYLNKGEQMIFVEVSMKNGNNYLIYKIDDKKYYTTFNAEGTKFFEGLATPVEMAAPADK